ncbi:MAG: nuclear transport factor 2 family protein [Pseudomonadota bacterium]
MKKSVIPLIAILALLSACASNPNSAETRSATAQEAETLQTAQAFLQAAGSGDGEALNKLMSEDFYWHNEGDSRIPWIGTWRGKEAVFGQFMPAFGAGLRVTEWNTEYSFVTADQAVFIGSMSADATTTGRNTGSMSWAVRVHVKDGKVKSWNWFEDSYAVSKAFHGE